MGCEHAEPHPPPATNIITKLYGNRGAGGTNRAHKEERERERKRGRERREGKKSIQRRERGREKGREKGIYVKN